jgi:poly(A) polymerase
MTPPFEGAGAGSRALSTESIGIRAVDEAAGDRAVIAALEARGYAGCARFVGGCVRNTLMGKPVDDIDIATTLTPDLVIDALEQAGLRAIPTGVDHGTITACPAAGPTRSPPCARTSRPTAAGRWWPSPRTGARTPSAAISASTPSMPIPKAGSTIRPARASNDAREGRVVFVGDPMTRIREDYLRILRFFRFQAWYGKGEADQKALAACKALKGMVSGRAAERTQKELMKMLAADDPRPALRLMAATSVLSLDPAVGQVPGPLRGLVAIETEQLFENDPEPAPGRPDPGRRQARRADRRAPAPAQQHRDRIVEAVGKEPRMVSWMSPREARRGVYRLGVRAFCDRVKLAWAGSGRRLHRAAVAGLAGLAETWSPPAFPLSGEEVMKAGVPKGPLVGDVMREIEVWWIDQDFIEDKFSAIERLKAVAQGMVY